MTSSPTPPPAPAPDAKPSSLAPPDSTAVLEARGVFRVHEVDGGQTAILKNVSFTLGRGEFTTIMGPSGSGKSTLLHLLAGLDVPSAGEVFVAGRPMSAEDEEGRTTLRRRYVGIVFQFFNLLPDLTVRENVALPLLIAGEPAERHRERVDELMRTLGIERLADRRPHRLSGGEMQRVSIARALVVRPPLILADEPTGNLSSKAGEEIVALLKDVSQRLETTVLLVTHNPRDAAAGDRVLFLSDGAMNPDHALTGGGFDAADVFRRLESLGI
jgi:putative ABC transport system ATP-binding protein